MPKRFIDSSIWEIEWFQMLPPEQKLAFIFMFTKCDSVGVWNPNKSLAEFLIGEKVDWRKFLEEVNGNVKVLPDGKWYMPDFCDFQYGKLTEKCPPHRTYIALLKKHGLYKQRKKPEKKTVEGKKEYQSGVFLKEEEYSKLCDDYGKVAIDSKIEDLSNYIGSQGKQYKDHNKTLRAWLKREGVPRAPRRRICECGYDATNTTMGTCPRCGEAI